MYIPVVGGAGEARVERDDCPGTILRLRVVPFGIALDLRRITSQNCESVPMRAHIEGT
jgi:hypothetical protein